MLGFVAEIPVFDQRTRKPVVIDGQMQYRPIVRTLDGSEFSLHPRNVLTGGIQLNVAQRVEFVAGTHHNRADARQVKRLVSRPSKRHARIHAEIADKNGDGGYMPAVVDRYFPGKGYGFARLVLNGEEIFLHEENVVVEDNEDIPCLRNGNRVLVKLSPERPQEGRRAKALHIIFDR